MPEFLLNQLYLVVNCPLCKGLSLSATILISQIQAHVLIHWPENLIHPQQDYLAVQ